MTTQELSGMTKEQLIALVQAKQQTTLNLRVSAAGYIEAYGVPGKGKYSVSNTPEGWELIFSRQAEIKAFIAQQKAGCAAKLAAYRLAKASA